MPDVKEAATRKLGPLPAWGWGVAVGGAFLVFRLFRGGKSGTPNAGYTPTVGGGTGVIGTAGDATPTDIYSGANSEFTQLQQQVTGQETAISNLTAMLEDISEKIDDLPVPPVFSQDVGPDPIIDTTGNEPPPQNTTPPPTNTPPPTTTAQTYTIKSGDTLWSIATKFYGSGTSWHKIYDANKSVIDSAAKNHGFTSLFYNHIYAGTKLTIPQ